jgi:hypothetical protein
MTVDASSMSLIKEERYINVAAVGGGDVRKTTQYQQSESGET